MLCTTRGIVLHSVPYNDKYSIIHIYTEFFGRTSYLITRNRKRKTMVSHALFIPLSIIEMEVEHKNTRDIQRIKEAKICYPSTSIPFHPVKNAIALFLAEILYRTLQTKESDTKLFNYLYNSIQCMEILEQGIANFHLVFLIQLVRHLGIYPNSDSYQPGMFFDLLNGIFTTHLPGHSHYLNKEEGVIFSRLLRMNYENMPLYSFSGQERSNIIYRILEYYRLHLSNFPEIKSLSIMQNLFS